MPKTLLVPILFILAAAALHAQSGKTLDSVVLRYRFTEGETLTFRVVAFDSITINDKGGRALARERAELVIYRCEKVLPNDSGFIMSVVTTDYVATETLDTLPPISRTEHDWIGRKIRFQMTPTGSRKYLFGPEDPAGNAPGGPFEPMLLPTLGTPERTHVGASDIFQNEQWLLETVFPPIYWKGTVFRVVKGRVDTMGQKTIHLAQTEVATAGHQSPGEGNPKTVTVYNGGRQFFFAPDLGYVLGGSGEILARFTMEFPNGNKIDGRHIMSMYYELLVDEPQASTKKKQSKKGR
jgi:hypothetical protein